MIFAACLASLCVWSAMIGFGAMLLVAIDE